MFYRNKVTNEVADMLVAYHLLIVTIQDSIPSMSMQVLIPKGSRFYWMTDLNPPALRTVDPDEFDQWALIDPSRDIPITRRRDEPVPTRDAIATPMARVVDICINDADTVIRVVGEANVIVRGKAR